MFEACQSDIRLCIQSWVDVLGRSRLLASHLVCMLVTCGGVLKGSWDVGTTVTRGYIRLMGTYTSLITAPSKHREPGLLPKF